MSANSWKSIVVAIRDPNAKTQMAIRKASEIARRCNARVTLLHIFAFPYPLSADTNLSSTDVLSQVAASWRKTLSRLAEPLKKAGLKVECAVEWDYPIHEGIVRYVLKTTPDLLIAESHHHSTLARWFLSNTDWELIRSCPCPLWFVKTPGLPKSPAIMAAVDPFHANAKPADLDTQIMNTACIMSKRLGGHVTIAHARAIPLMFSTAMPMDAIPVPPSQEEIRRFELEATRALTPLARKYAIKPADQLVALGSPGAVIDRFVKKLGIDLVVMGAVSRRGLKRAFIGSTAEQVIDLVQCDALILKPKEFKTTTGHRRLAVTV